MPQDQVNSRVKGRPRLSWQAQTTDLNPTENLWNVIKWKTDSHCHAMSIFAQIVAM